jgi:hypothetical protein
LCRPKRANLLFEGGKIVGGRTEFDIALDDEHVKAGYKIQPKFGCCPEEMCKSQSRVARDSASSVQDFSYTIGWNPELPRKLSSTHAEFFEFFRQTLARVNCRNSQKILLVAVNDLPRLPTGRTRRPRWRNPRPKGCATSAERKVRRHQRAECGKGRKERVGNQRVRSHNRRSPREVGMHRIAILLRIKLLLLSFSSASAIETVRIQVMICGYSFSRVFPRFGRYTPACLFPHRASG